MPHPWPRRRRSCRRFPVSPESLEARCVLAGDLLAQWIAEDFRATEPDGAMVGDWHSSNSGIVAQVDGAPTLRHDGIQGRATLEFIPEDGTDQFRVNRLQSPMSNATDFTVAVVFATDSANLQGAQGNWFDNTAIVDANSLGLANDWGISINASGQVAAGLGFGFGKTPVTIYSPSANWNDGQWHLVVYRREGSTISLQVDDAEIVSRPDGHPNPLTSLDLSIGAQKFGTLPFDGEIAEVSVYNGALDDSQLSELRGQLQRFYDNQLPQGVPDSYTLTEDPLLYYQPSPLGVLANDTDAEDDHLTARLVSNAQHGDVTLNADGSFIYDPDRDFFGEDRFVYAVSDFREAAPVEVTLNVLPAYDAVVTVADVYKAIPQETLVIPSEGGVLANDRNPDRAELRAILEQDVASGSLQLNTDGSFAYDPEGFAGVTTFQYRVHDGTQLSPVAAVTLIVNSPPRVSDDLFQVSEDTLLSVTPANGVLRNDSDADENPLSVTLVEDVQHGTLGLAPNGSLLYTPDPNFFGEDRFTYRVSDGVDDSEVATVRLQVQSINDLPLAQADGYVGLPNQSLVVPAVRGVLANDVDVDAPTLTAQLVDGPQHGRLQLEADGSFTYTPNAEFLGDDHFSYRASDELSSSATTRVNLTITATPVVISEFMATNATFLPTHIFEEGVGSFTRTAMTPDWIELHNLVSSPIDLSGMHLTDDPDAPAKWTIPDGILIPPNERIIIYASGFDITDLAQDSENRLHTNFSLDSDGGYLALTFRDGTLLSEFASYPKQRADVSYGSRDGGVFFFPAPSPLTENSAGIGEAVADTQFSVDRGFFAEAFIVEITSATPGATIAYTTDGSDPSPDHGSIVSAISGDSTPIAAITISGSTTLRAMAFKPEMLATNIDTQTYLFIRDVLQQNQLGSTVMNDATWGPQMEASLLALPTVSLVTPGRISVNETGTSMELIFPDGTKGFQVNAGVEHYGGHSLNSPKKNMRLSFKAEYGDSSLNYDLFGPGATDRFQQLLLRTGSHDTWFWTHPSGGQGNYVRNRWAFDRQLEMGQLAPHGRFVQVYINGTYWGMHHLMERPNADFMASYLGGQSYQYDALNAGTPVDGDTKAWTELQRDAVIDDYAQLQQYLDVENYADYMLLQFYAGNDWDWNVAQNWMAARKREPGSGFVFFSWDSDVMLRSTANANVINRGGPGNLWNLRGGVKQHPEFLLLMADRAHQYLFGDGMLTDDRLRADVNALANQIRLPLIAETARWGGRTYTPDTWEGAIQWMLDRYAPTTPGGRAETLLTQLRRAGIYPSVDAPELTVNSQLVYGGDLQPGEILTFAAAGGPIYYTLDGSDPRLPGGELNPAALLASETPLVLDRKATIIARVLQDETWSALNQATFRYNVTSANPTNLRITEIHYHPADPTAVELAAGFRDADDFEFIELQNISDKTVDLSQVRFVSTESEGQVEGVAFDFGSGQIRELFPGDRLVVVEDLSAFAMRYGEELPVAGQWTGGLGNRSERLTLVIGEVVIQQLAYSDQWHPVTDGDGPSLQLIDPATSTPDDWQVAAGWRASRQAGGSPGTGDDFLPGDANRDGVFNSADLVAVFVAGQYEDLIPGNSRWESGDWDDDGDFTSADLVLALALGSYVPDSVAQRQPDLQRVQTVESLFGDSDFRESLDDASPRSPSDTLLRGAEQATQRSNPA